MTKTLVIGDIHGCFDELQALLDKAGISDDDKIISLGDMVDRGPFSPRVVDFFQHSSNASAIIGNHEKKHLRWTTDKIKVSDSQRISKLQFGDKYHSALQFFKSLPDYIELKEVILIHGFFEPKIPLKQQKKNVVNGTMSGDSYLIRNYSKPWYELYNGEKPIICGHKSYNQSDKGLPFIYNDLVYGIDTYCCFGKSLTGLILPEFKLISVTSKKHYWYYEKQAYRDSNLREKPIASYTWKEIENVLSSDSFTINDETKEKLKEVKVQAEKYLKKILISINNECANILKLLMIKCYNEHSKKEQFEMFEEQIQDKSLSKLIHKARKSQLTMEYLKGQFNYPYQLIKTSNG